MLSRLPISLVQLKVGNNSEKLKNEVRQSTDQKNFCTPCTDQKNLQKKSIKV